MGALPLFSVISADSESPLQGNMEVSVVLWIYAFHIYIPIIIRVRIDFTGIM